MATKPLHCSLYELCRRQITADRAFMKLKKFKTSPDVDLTLFEEYRLFKFRKTMAYVAEKSRFYRKLFAGENIVPSDIRSLNDISRIPFTTAEDVAADPFAFLCMSQSMIEWVITFISSGTVGPKKQIFFSEADIDAMTDFICMGMKTVADTSDVVQILLPEGLVLGQADLLAGGLLKMGARPVKAGMFLPPDEQIEMIRKNGSTVLVGETHLIYRITKAMERQCDLASLDMKTLLLTTSYASPVMIEYLRRAWNARVCTHYGLTEMGLALAIECQSCGAYHFNELDVLGEVVDPSTGRVLPPGSAGELVFTTLWREAMPFIRYRTSDLAVSGEAEKACGTGLMTIKQVKSRIESHVQLRDGSDLYPTIFHDTIFNFPEIIDYEVGLDFLDGKEHLIIEAEVYKPNDVLRQGIINALRRDYSEKSLNLGELKIQVAFKEPGSLRQGVHFKKIINDRRKESLFPEHGLSGEPANGIVAPTGSSPVSSGRLHGN